MAVRTRLITPLKSGTFFSARSNPSSCRTASTITRRGRSQLPISQTTLSTEGIFRRDSVTMARFIRWYQSPTDCAGPSSWPSPPGRRRPTLPLGEGWGKESGMLQPLLIDHAYAWSAGANDFADHRCAGGAVLFQNTFHFLQSFGRNTEQQAATRLCVCKQKAHRLRSGVPFHNGICCFEILSCPARNTVLRDERENLAANHRHFCGDDFCADSTSATHRGEMSEQPKPSHINSRANQAKLSQLGTDDVQLAHERDGLPH